MNINDQATVNTSSSYSSKSTLIDLDGHEIAVMSTLTGMAALINRTLPEKWLKGFIHRQPVAAMSLAWGFIGITLPLIVPRVRRAMQLPTNQYDATHRDTVFPKYY